MENLKTALALLNTEKGRLLAIVEGILIDNMRSLNDMQKVDDVKEALSCINKKDIRCLDDILFHADIMFTDHKALYSTIGALVKLDECINDVADTIACEAYALEVK